MKTQSRMPALLLLFSMLLPTLLFAQAPPSGIARAVCPGYRPAPDPASQPDSAFQYFDKTVRLLDAVPEPDGSVLVWCMASQGNIITWSDSRPHSPDTLALFSARFNTRGQLDTNYGRQGWLQYQPPVFSSVEGAQVARQADGKWLVAYEFTDKQGIILMRFDPDGQLDSSFRSGGYVYFTNDEANEDKLLHLSALPDGKIRLLASSRYGLNNYDCRLIQLQPDGFRDTTFDADGVLRLLSNQPWVGDCAVLPDGRITLCTYDLGWLHLYRFQADGHRDMSFGSNGTLRTRFVSFGSGGFFTQLPNGGLLLRGDTSRFCETGLLDTEFFVKELDVRGRPDSVFVQAGSPLGQEKASIRYQHALNDATLLSLSHDGDLWCSGPGCKGQGNPALGFSDQLGLEKIISAPTGHVWLFGHTPDGLLAVRLLPDGSLDPAFGLDSLALRAQGFRPRLKKEGAKTIFGLEEINPRSPLYSVVTVSSFSTAGMSQKDSVMVLQPQPTYHDKFKNGGPYPSYSVEYAAASGKAGHNQHLCLSQETISAQAPGWAEIPAERLQGLSLINCRFEGVPTHWQRFKNLELLAIHFATADEARQLPLNQVLAWFPNLEVLILSVPGATEIPKGLLKLNKLRVLELHLPQLEHFPKEILRLRGLQELRLTFRCSAGIPAQLEQLSALEILDIKGEGPGATLQLPETLGRLSQLKELRLSNGARPAVLPLSLGQLTVLNKLELINAGIEALPDSIGQCQQLQELKIKTNGVFQSMPAGFFELPELKLLTLDVCQPALELRLQTRRLQEIQSTQRLWAEIRLNH